MENSGIGIHFIGIFRTMVYLVSIKIIKYKEIYMSNESEFSWKFLIPGYGIYLIKKSEMQGQGKFIALNVVIILFIMGLMGGGSEETTERCRGIRPVPFQPAGGRAEAGMESGGYR